MALASRASCSVADTICPRPLQVVTCRPSRSWLNFGHGIKRPGDLDLWPFDLKTGHNVTHGTDNFPAYFGVSVTFLSIMGKHASNWRRDVITLTFDLRPWNGVTDGHPSPELRPSILDLGSGMGQTDRQFWRLYHFKHYSVCPVGQSIWVMLKMIQTSKLLLKMELASDSTVGGHHRSSAFIFYANRRVH